MRLPDKVAGKRVRCPKCQDVIQVPATRRQAPADSTAAKSGSKVRPQSVAVDLWHLQTEDGETYGPVPKPEMDEWVTEGRVTAECQLLREGDDQWQWATDVYPHIAEEEAPAAESAASPFPAVGETAAAEEPTIAAPSGGGGGGPFDFGSDDMSPTARIGGGRRKSHGISRSGKSPGQRAAKSGAVTAVAIVNYVLGALEICCGGLIIVAGGMVASMLGGAIGEAAAQEGNPEAAEAVKAVSGAAGAIVVVIGVVALIFGIVIIAAGYGVQQRAGWGRILTLVLGGVAGLFGALSFFSIFMGNLGGLVGAPVYGAYCGMAFGILLNKKYAAEFR